MTISIKDLNNIWKKFELNKKTSFLEDHKIVTKLSSNRETINKSIPNQSLWFFRLYNLGFNVWNDFFKFCKEEEIAIEVNFSNFTFSSTINFSHFEFPDINFSNCKFEGDAIFQGAKWYGKVNFSKILFLKDAIFIENKFQKVNFYKTAFHKQANFSETKFEKIDFSSTKFFETINFSGVEFLKEVNFSHESFANNSTSFEKAKFYKTVNFHNFSFLKVDFSFAEFHQPILFQKALFKEKVDFVETKFLDKVDFSEAVFETAANFCRANFSKETIFISCDFQKQANFHSISTKKGDVVEGKISFHQSCFREKTSFKNYKINQKTDFSYTSFQEFPEFDLENTLSSHLLNFNNIKISTPKRLKELKEKRTLDKITQFKTLIQGIENKDLKKKIFYLEKTTEKKLEFYQIYQSLKDYWDFKKDKKNNFFTQLLFFIPFLFSWTTKSTLWGFKFVSFFIWRYSFCYEKSYTRPILYLLMLYPIFYFLYGLGGKIGLGTRWESQIFVFSHYFPFSSGIPLFQWAQNQCFPGGEPLNIFYLSSLQTFFSLFFLYVLTYNFYEKSIFFKQNNNIKNFTSSYLQLLKKGKKNQNVKNIEENNANIKDHKEEKVEEKQDIILADLEEDLDFIPMSKEEEFSFIFEKEKPNLQKNSTVNIHLTSNENRLPADKKREIQNFLEENRKENQKSEQIKGTNISDVLKATNKIEANIEASLKANYRPQINEFSNTWPYKKILDSEENILFTTNSEKSIRKNNSLPPKEESESLAPKKEKKRD